MNENAIYIKADRNIKVESKTVHVSDIATIYAKDKKISKNVGNLVLYEIKENKKKNYVFSILKVIEIIQKAYPNHLICSLGENDFIVEYSTKTKEHKLFDWIKIGFVCLIAFFGAAFTIMTFNEDASVTVIFEKIYEAVLNTDKVDIKWLEISYAIGLPIGSLVFFNHFAKFKVTEDPTPLQIQLRLNEQEINQTLVDNAGRDGKSIDVD